MTKENQKKRTQENMTMINEEMRRKNEGLTLSEKITQHAEKIKQKKTVQLIDDAFFSEEVDQGAKFFVRRTNLLREGNRYRNVEDEVQKAQKLQAELEAIEAKRDQTFEEFKSKYDDHIEGRANNTRVARHSNFGEDVKSRRSVSNRGKGKKTTSQRSEPGEDEDDAKSRKSGKADLETAE